MTLSPRNTLIKLSAVFFFAMCLGGANCQPAPDRTLCSSDAQCGEGRVCNEETNRCEDADGGNNGTDGGNNGTDGGTDTEVSAEIAEQNEFIQLVSDDGATPWRYIGIKRDPNRLCPQPTSGDFNGRELFAQDQGANDTLPPALRKFCLYESTLIEFDPAQPGVPAELQALTSPNLPDQLISIEPDHMGLAGSSKLTTEYQRSFFNETKEHGGKLGFLPTDSNEPQRVRIAVLDSSPTADWNSGAQVFGRSMHGHGIANIARELTCDNNGQCMADISTQMAMPLYYESGNLVQDPFNGGDFGSIAWLAEAIFRETRAWKQSESHEHLVLNLSLGWSPDYGGDSGTPSSWPNDVKAVYHAIGYAHCAGALVVAAAGNATGGATGDTGALLPALWETHEAPSPNYCPQLAGNDQDESIFASPAGYRPLLFAASGDDNKGDDIAIARDGGRARLAAYADHAVVLGADIDGDGVSNFTDAMTGTSVSTAVLSSAAASVWYYRPELTFFDVMELVYDGATTLSNLPDFCEGGACGDTKRVTVCESVQKACDSGLGACPAAGSLPVCDGWDQSPIDTSSFDFANFDASAGATTMAYQEHVDAEGTVTVASLVNASCSEVATNLGEQDGNAVNQLAQCPESQAYGITAKPWTAPQPWGGNCDGCYMSTLSSMLRLTSSTDFSSYSSPTLSVKSNTGTVTNYSLGSLSGKDISISFSNLSLGNVSSASFTGISGTGSSISNSLYVND